MSSNIDRVWRDSQGLANLCEDLQGLKLWASTEGGVVKVFEISPLGGAAIALISEHDFPDEIIAFTKEMKGKKYCFVQSFSERIIFFSEGKWKKMSHYKRSCHRLQLSKKRFQKLDSSFLLKHLVKWHSIHSLSDFTLEWAW